MSRRQAYSPNPNGNLIIRTLYVSFKMQGYLEKQNNKFGKRSTSAKPTRLLRLRFFRLESLIEGELSASVVLLDFCNQRSQQKNIEGKTECVCAFLCMNIRINHKTSSPFGYHFQAV